MRLWRRARRESSGTGASAPERPASRLDEPVAEPESDRSSAQPVTPGASPTSDVPDSAKAAYKSGGAAGGSAEAAEEIERLLLSGPVDWFELEKHARSLTGTQLPERRAELLADLDDTYVSRRWLAARTLAGDALAQVGEAERAARVDPRRRVAELVTRSDLRADEAAELLADLYDAYVLDDFHHTGDSPRSHVIRAVGERLDQLGGFALMLETHERFAALRPPRSSPSPGAKLERAWHGIGSWMA
jgi:hypothetical protein